MKNRFVFALFIGFGLLMLPACSSAPTEPMKKEGSFLTKDRLPQKPRK